MNVSASQVKTGSSSLAGMFLNVFVTPGEVFEEVLAAPPTAAHWRIPALLLCLAGMISTYWVGNGFSPEIGAPMDAQLFAGAWPVIAALSILVSLLLGMLWCALLLWMIGRVCLRTQFSFLKTIEVVGFTGMILVLGTVVTSLLVLLTGDGFARPALSLFAPHLSSGEPLRQLLDTLNIFHIWSATVLAIGLSKLSGVTFKEAAFWVFGFWFFARVGLILLS